MSQTRVEVWLEDLKALSAAARAYDACRQSLSAEADGNSSEFAFEMPYLDVTLYGHPTGWSIQHWDGATWVVFEPVVDEPAPL